MSVGRWAPASRARTPHDDDAPERERDREIVDRLGEDVDRHRPRTSTSRWRTSRVRTRRDHGRHVAKRRHLGRELAAGDHDIAHRGDPKCLRRGLEIRGCRDGASPRCASKHVKATPVLVVGAKHQHPLRRTPGCSALTTKIVARDETFANRQPGWRPDSAKRTKCAGAGAVRAFVRRPANVSRPVRPGVLGRGAAWSAAPRISSTAPPMSTATSRPTSSRSTDGPSSISCSSSTTRPRWAPGRTDSPRSPRSRRRARRTSRRTTRSSHRGHDERRGAADLGPRRGSVHRRRAALRWQPHRELQQHAARRARVAGERRRNRLWSDPGPECHAARARASEFPRDDASLGVVTITATDDASIESVEAMRPRPKRAVVIRPP